MTPKNHKGTTSAEERRFAGELGLDPDDLMVRAFKPVIRLEREVNAWTETNLELIRLLTARTQETERLAQNFAQLSSTYEHLNRQLVALQQQMQPLSKHLEQGTTPPLGLNESQVQGLFTHLKQLTAQVQKVSAQSTAESWIWSRKSWAIGIAISAIAGVGHYSVLLSRQVQHLERLESEGAAIAAGGITLEQVQDDLATSDEENLLQ